MNHLTCQLRVYFYIFQLKKILHNFTSIELTNQNKLVFLTYSELSNNFTHKQIKIITSILPDIANFKDDIQVAQAKKNLLFFSQLNNNMYQVYLSRNAINAIYRINETLYTSTGCRLSVTSGYRSPSYQALLFIKILHLNHFNYAKTAKRVAAPTFSQHCDSVNPAIDFENTHGMPSFTQPELFSYTKEAEWLRQNAFKFGLRQIKTLTTCNYTTITEPWHWSYCKNYTCQI